MPLLTLRKMIDPASWEKSADNLRKDLDSIQNVFNNATLQKNGVHALATRPQTIADSIWTPLQFDRVDGVDTASILQSSINFVVPASGEYLCHLSATIPAIGAGVLSAKLQSGGFDVYGSGSNLTTTLAGTLHVSVMVTSLVNDVLNFLVMQTTGSPLALGSTTPVYQIRAHVLQVA